MSMIFAMTASLKETWDAGYSCPSLFTVQTLN